MPTVLGGESGDGGRHGEDWKYGTPYEEGAAAISSNEWKLIEVTRKFLVEHLRAIGEVIVHLGYHEKNTASIILDEKASIAHNMPYEDVDGVLSDKGFMQLVDQGDYSKARQITRDYLEDDGMLGLFDIFLTRLENVDQLTKGERAIIKKLASAFSIVNNVMEKISDIGLNKRSPIKIDMLDDVVPSKDESLTVRKILSTARTRLRQVSTILADISDARLDEILTAAYEGRKNTDDSITTASQLRDALDKACSSPDLKAIKVKTNRIAQKQRNV